MYLHREGRKLILGLLAVVLVIYAAMIFLVQHWTFFHFLFIAILLVFWVLVSLFFRIPRRVFTEDSQRLISPADGTVITMRKKSNSDGTPVVDINIKSSSHTGGIKGQKIHFVQEDN